MRYFALLFALPFAAHAGSLTYSASGVFGPAVPVSIFTAPNQTWSFTFTLDVNPVVATPEPGGFNPLFTGFSYRLNGIDQAITPTVISFWDTVNAGMFGMDFAADSRFSFAGPQMFTGPTTAPTMLPGAFVSTTDATYDYLSVDGIKYGSLAGTTVYATPEPATWSLLAGGALGVLALRRRVANRH